MQIPIYEVADASQIELARDRHACGTDGCARSHPARLSALVLSMHTTTVLPAKVAHAETPLWRPSVRICEAAPRKRSLGARLPVRHPIFARRTGQQRPREPLRVVRPLQVAHRAHVVERNASIGSEAKFAALTLAYLTGYTCTARVARSRGEFSCVGASKSGWED